MKKLIAIALCLSLVSCPDFVQAATDKVYLEITDDIQGYVFTRVDKDIYSIDLVYDDMEETYGYVLRKNGDIAYTFNEYWGPRGICQIDGVVYIALVDSVVKYVNGKMVTVLKESEGPIKDMASNGRDIYIECDDDSPKYQSYIEGSFYKVTTKGEATRIKGLEVAIGWHYSDFTVNKSGDRLARVPYLDDGTKVRRMDGTEYFQRVMEEDQPHATGGEFTVANLLYYNDCLIANVNGSLVYYDAKNKPHVILGDMKGDRSYLETWQCQPGDSLPVKSGYGDKVRIGYVDTWFVAEDGYIYGRTMVNYDTYESFKLTLPDFIKKTVTYKKVTASLPAK